LNQQFELIYVDEMPAPPKEGDMVAAFGMRVGMPFHIKSGLPQGRYLDLVGRSMVIKTPADTRTTQSWYFDWKTKTIKNWKNRGWSFDIHSVVELIDFKLGIPTLDGGKSSNTMLDQKCSPTSRITRLLMFLEAEIKKVTVFKSGERTTLLHRSGRSCI